jgi:hypothetical protein
VEDRHINDGFHLDAHGFVDITWCRKKHIQSWHHLIETFKTANGKKAIAATQFNQASTRGHCILVFEADMPHPTKQGVRRTGRLYVCDLAGAEPAASVRDLGVNETCWLYSRGVTLRTESITRAIQAWTTFFLHALVLLVLLFSW